MTAKQSDRPRQPVVTDHPESLGQLAPIFVRRKIAMAADLTGELVLVRPDSGVIDTTDQADYERALKGLARLGDAIAGRFPKRRSRSGLISFSIPGIAPGTDNGEERWSVSRLSEVLDQLRRAGVDAEPNHVMLASQGVTGSPVGAQASFTGGMLWTAEIRTTDKGPMLRSTSDPAPPPDPGALAQPLQLDGRKRPRVLVLDTGLRTQDGAGAAVESPELAGCVVVHSSWKQNPAVEAVDDEDEADDDGFGFLDFEGGHGTFISGVIRQICPDAEIHIAGVLSSFGDGDVATVTAAFERALTNAKGSFDIVVMSFGGYMTDDDGTSFGRALARLLGTGVGVSAAGNQATSRRYYPAADPDIVGVGALGEDGRAWFSNFGGWVDACAPGIDVVSTFFTDFTDPPFTDPVTGAVDAGRTYRGWARWSGTSFSAPKVAAVIAQEMYVHDISARTAWRHLSHYQRYRYPDLGTVFNV